MKIEIRADSAIISGYVNATEKKSRPVVTPRGKVVEEIEPRAFQSAIDRAGEITVTVDHDETHVYASTRDGSLTLYEDEIGLHAETVIRDPTLIELARTGKIRGWSFGMYNVVDEMEDRADNLPLRKVKQLDLDHVSLIVRKNPIYSATSVEVRAGKEADVEVRAFESDSKITEFVQETPKTPFFDNSEYKRRVEIIKNKTWREKR